MCEPPQVSSPLFSSPQPCLHWGKRRDPQHDHTFYSMSVEKKPTPHSTGSNSEDSHCRHNQEQHIRRQGATLENGLGGPPSATQPIPLTSPGLHQSKQGQMPWEAQSCSHPLEKVKENPESFGKKIPHISETFQLQLRMMFFSKLMNKICKQCILAPTVISKVSTKPHPGWIFRKYLLF